MAGNLSPEQRWLLFAIGGWMMRDCLLGPAGTDHLMQSCYSSWGFTGPDGGPDWLTGWNTANGKISAPQKGTVRVSVTKAQINSYAATLPADIRRELTDCRDAAHAEQQRTASWCHCPWRDIAPNPHSGPCQHYHPTDAEDDQHRARVHALNAWQTRLLRRALQLQCAGEQLDLFSGLA
ncbi:hypothetical protein O982_24830 [Mycobacterium avium 10-5581]|nr:hypothetical protein O982_24830 [Mycobacterium avium 10-5581]